jgi:uncharacterized membrane protein YkvA (DUF1232 family)
MTEPTTTPPSNPPQESLLPSPFVNEQGEPRNSAIRDALGEFWIALKRLPSYVKLVTAMGKDERVPKSAKAILIGGGIYTVSPIDLVPGVIPVAGQLDDLYVILTAIQQAVRLTPDDVAAEHLARHEITKTDIDHDLAAVRTLVKEAAKVGFAFGVKSVKQAGSRIRQFAGQVQSKRGPVRDDKPL